MSTSESSETVMPDMKVNKKTQKREQTDSKAMKSSKHKANGIKRLNELLGIVRHCYIKFDPYPLNQINCNYCLRHGDDIFMICSLLTIFLIKFLFFMIFMPYHYYYYYYYYCEY